MKMSNTDARIYEQARREREAAREAAEREHEAELEKARKLNDEARRKWDAKVEADRRERAAQERAALEERLAPVKERRKREWLAANTGRSGSDFDRDVWPLVRENIIEDEQRELVERTEREMAPLLRSAF